MTDERIPYETAEGVVTAVDLDGQVHRAHARETTVLKDGDPETSHEAAESISSTSISEQKERIMFVLDQLVVGTDKQIIRAYRKTYGAKGGPSEQSIRSRRSELVKAGFVRFSGKYSEAGRTRERLWEVVK